VGLIFDTSILIGAERGRFDMPAFLGGHETDEIGLAAITASELLHGCERAVDPEVRARRWRYVEGLLASIPVIPFGLLEARHHARVWAALAGQGTPIGAHDLLVAATALAAGWSIATLNRQDFSRVDGLRLTDTADFERGGKTGSAPT
jgi:predicted nucleic acid-binding protein